MTKRKSAPLPVLVVNTFKRKPPLVLTKRQVVIIINKEQAKQFGDGIVWIKESNWKKSGHILIYDYNIQQNVYVFIRRGMFEENAQSGGSKAFSIFNKLKCPLYLDDTPRVRKNASKTNRRTESAIKSHDHILKILARQKVTFNRKFEQLRFLVSATS